MQFAYVIDPIKPMKIFSSVVSMALRPRQPVAIVFIGVNIFSNIDILASLIDPQP